MKKEYLKINQWLIEISSGDCRRIESTFNEPDIDAILAATVVSRLEKKAVELLNLLTNPPGTILSKDVLLASLWPQQVVSEDALTRCVSQLRKALNDNPKHPKIIETLPKRGYRLIAESVSWHEVSKNTFAKNTFAHNAESEDLVEPEDDVSADSAFFKTLINTRTKSFGLLAAVLVIVLALIIQQLKNTNEKISTDTTASESVNSVAEPEFLIARADDYYHTLRQHDNAMAIKLYQQAVDLKPNAGDGQAGLANALVQQVIRWPQEVSDIPQTDNSSNTAIKNNPTLRQAIDSGLTKTESAKAKLDRALALAQRAVRVSPNSARTHKALGFVLSAREELILAIDSYNQALTINPDAWDVLINLGELYEMTGKPLVAIEHFEKAFAAMGRVYKTQSARIKPWYADLGVLIGRKYYSIDQLEDAEAWYRHVLTFAPYHASATAKLANILASRGDLVTAEKLCIGYAQAIGESICMYSN